MYIMIATQSKTKTAQNDQQNRKKLDLKTLVTPSDASLIRNKAPAADILLYGKSKRRFCPLTPVF